MSFEALLARDVESRFGGEDPIFRYQVCKNRAYRDTDENRFVTAMEYDENEHSRDCECAECVGEGYHEQY